jgi:hypothetical protein
MKPMPEVLALLCVLAFAWTTPVSLADQDETVPEEPSTWEQVLVYYEKAKAAGEQVPQDVYEWAKLDLSKIGDWEYRVESIGLSSSTVVQNRLNELGASRWECIWIDYTGEKPLFVFKRPARSYLQNLSLSQLMKLVPRGQSDDSGD